MATAKTPVKAPKGKVTPKTDKKSPSQPVAKKVPAKKSK